jgi:TRAP-type mannitol/chloroaromatic compound transport system permease large subunit
MTAFIIAYMAPLMFATLVIFLLLGYPVAVWGPGRGRV